MGMENNCTNCKFFTSFQAEFQDDLEPEDIGRCNKDILEFADYETICGHYESLTAINKAPKI